MRSIRCPLPFMDIYKQLHMEQGFHLKLVTDALLLLLKIFNKCHLPHEDRSGSVGWTMCGGRTVRQRGRLTASVRRLRGTHRYHGAGDVVDQPPRKRHFASSGTIAGHRAHRTGHYKHRLRFVARYR